MERKVQNLSNRYYTSEDWKFSPSKAWNINLGLGYQSRHWIMETGLGYAYGGYTRSISTAQFYNVSSGSIHFGSTNKSETIYYRHIMLPCKLGYEIRLPAHFLVVPAAGITYSHNLNNIIKYTFDGIDYKRRVKDELFDLGYNKNSLWASAQVCVRYRINNKCAVSVAPHFNYMLTSMVKNEYATFEHSSLKLFNYSINAGMSWSLSKSNAVKK